MARPIPPSSNRTSENNSPNNPTVGDVAADRNRNTATDIREQQAERRRIADIAKSVKDAIAKSPKIAAQVSLDASKATLQHSADISKAAAALYVDKALSTLLLKGHQRDDIDRIWAGMKGAKKAIASAANTNKTPSPKQTNAALNGEVKIVDPDVARETTQTKVVDGITDLTELSKTNLTATGKTNVVIANKVDDVTTRLEEIENTLGGARNLFIKIGQDLRKTYKVERATRDLLKQQLDIQKIRNEREAEEVKRRQATVKALAPELDPTAVETAIPVPEEPVVFDPHAPFESLSGLAKVFRIITIVADIFNPFKKIILGGLLLTAAFGLVDSVTGMENIFSAISDSFGAFDLSVITGILGSFDAKAGIFNETLRILGELYNANFGFDLKMIEGIFKGYGISSGKFGELFKALSDIWVNQLVPAFEYLIKEVIVPLAVVIAVVIEKIAEYLTQEGPGLIEKFRAFAAFMADVLIVFFRDVLPPVLDLMGAIFKVAVGVVKEIAMILSYLLPAFRDYLGHAIDSLKVFFTSLTEIFTNVANVLNDPNASWGEKIGTLIKELVLKLPIAILDFIGRTADNMLTFVMDALGISEAFDRDTTKTVMHTIQDKINEFVQAVISIIPTFDDIVGLLKNAAKKIGSGASYIIDYLLGDSKAPPEGMTAYQPTQNLRQNDVIDNMIAAQQQAAKGGGSVVISNSGNSVQQAPTAVPTSSTSGRARTAAEFARMPMRESLVGGIYGYGGLAQ